MGTLVLHFFDIIFSIIFPFCLLACLRSFLWLATMKRRSVGKEGWGQTKGLIWGKTEVMTPKRCPHPNPGACGCCFIWQKRLEGVKDLETVYCPRLSRWDQRNGKGP